jgi:hypothetical protein
MPILKKEPKERFMKQEDTSLPALISQVSDLLQRIQTNTKPLNLISPEILTQLETLEKAMSAFVTINDTAIKDANIDIEKLNAEITGPSISVKDKRLLERAKIIERDAKYLQIALSKSIREDNQDDDVNKKKSKARQKKFKRLGGDGWLRL